jgi:hypothetical protein
MKQLAGLSEDVRELALERFRQIQPHLEEHHSLQSVARAAGIPYRTAQRWVARYRRFGLAARCCMNGSVLAKISMSSGGAVWTLSGSLTGLRGSGGIARDPAGNVWAANWGGLMRYTAANAGNEKPTHLIYGPATHYPGPGAVAINAGGNVYVAYGYPGSIVEYRADATGNVPPIAVLSGRNTRLEAPVGIAVGP